MSGLVEFLKARIDEDEAGARQAIELRRAYPHDGERKIAGDAAASDWEFTPERLLAECEAKRRIIAVHEDRSIGWCDHCLDGADDACPTLLALAAPYSSHPDFPAGLGDTQHDR